MVGYTQLEEGRRVRAQAWASPSSADYYHAQARSLIFQAHNAGHQLDTIDLHELLVSEALEELKKRVAELNRNGYSSLTVITGQGLHSRGGVAKIKPSVVQWAISSGISYQDNTPASRSGCVAVTHH